MGVVAAAATLLGSDDVDSARLSLARTAHELMGLPTEPGPAVPLKVPLRHVADSAYGRLNHVPPPLLLDGRGVEFAQPPVAYGRSLPVWA